MAIIPPGTTTGTGPLQGAAGVEGDAASGNGVGVRGKNDFIKATGFLAGPNPFAGNTAIGAYGESDQQGVVGIANTPVGIGVYGGSRGGVANGVMGETASAIGVLGRSGSAAGTGIQGENKHGGFAAQFLGKVFHDGELTCTQTMQAFDFSVAGGDCAEDFEIIGQDKAEPGTVMVLDGEGALTPSYQAYDKKVAGVISGAGGYHPGIVLDRRSAEGNRRPLALIGKVYCKVDAQYSAIEVGDLLTTSPTLGHAMKAADPYKAFGATIGKALKGVAEGCTLIPILVALN